MTIPFKGVMTGLALLVLATIVSAAELEPVRVSADGSHFVLKNSGARFTPWGFNYLGEFETVFEEYWATNWPAIEEDFREMKKLGANVIRVHLQLPTYMGGPDLTKPEELARLRKLLDLARDHGMYLDLTGLSLYRLAQVPKWLDALSEADRWAAQARFWAAIAKVGCGHPWLGGELGGFHFVQRIANQPGKRTQAGIAAAWVAQMTQAIRKADPEGLITVGVIPWAQVWPNAKPVFYAPEAVKHLDFVSVHFYPRKEKLKEDLAALKVYDIGKPIVVEEIFPLGCSLEEMDAFMKGAEGIVEGWISHYFGKTAAEYRQKSETHSALIANFLDYWEKRAPKR